jgi:hypothetical protein
MRMSIRFITVCTLSMLLAAQLGVANAQTCVPVPGGLVGWWPANGTAEDAVAGNNGQTAGNTTFVPAVVNQGFKLDGFGDFVQIPDSPALKPAHMTVEAWVRFDSLDTPIVSQFGAPGLQYIVFKKNTRLFNFEAYALRKQRINGVDRLAFSVGAVDGGGTTAVATSTTAVVVGQFYHVVGTYDGAAVRLYVDGVLEGNAPVAVTVDYDVRPVFLGTSGETVFDGKLNGVIDEAAIYNRALGASEVSNIHAASTAGKCSSANGLLTSLASFAQSLNLSNGISNSLDAKLQNALQALDAANAGDSSSACNRMTAFVNEVNAQAGKAVAPAEASQLIALAQQIRSALGCR